MRPMGTTAYGGKGQGKGKGRGEGRLGQGGRGRSKGGEKPMGTTAYGGKGSKGRAANGDRPVGAASCRRDHHTMASCRNPPCQWAPPAADENTRPWLLANPPYGGLAYGAKGALRAEEEARQQPRWSQSHGAEASEQWREVRYGKGQDTRWSKGGKGAWLPEAGLKVTNYWGALHRRTAQKGKGKGTLGRRGTVDPGWVNDEEGGGVRLQSQIPELGRRKGTGRGREEKAKGRGDNTWNTQKQGVEEESV